MRDRVCSSDTIREKSPRLEPSECESPESRLEKQASCPATDGCFARAGIIIRTFRRLLHPCAVSDGERDEQRLHFAETALEQSLGCREDIAQDKADKTADIDELFSKAPSFLACLATPAVNSC